MKKAIFLLLGLFLVSAGQAQQVQTGALRGQVLDINGAPIQGASITLQGTTRGTSTNGNGSFFLKDVPVGTYVLIASSIGFESLKVDAAVETTTPESLRLQLAESVLDLPSLVIESVTLTGGLAGLKNLPGSAYYLSPKEMQRFNFTDINRGLRAIPGVNIQEEDGFGLRPNIGLRGAGADRSSKITVMEDGVLMSPAPYAAPAAYHFPTFGRMQAVEIMKGSSQIKHGPFTTGGAINLISTQIPDELAGAVNLFAGSFGTRNLHAHVGNSHKNVAYVAETFQHSSDGFKTLDAPGGTGFNKADYMLKFRVNTNPDAKVYQSLTFKAAQTSEQSNETYLGLTRDDFADAPLRRYAASQKDLMTTEHRHYTLTHFIQPAPFLAIVTTAYQTDFSRNWYKLDAVKNDEGVKRGISTILDNPALHSNAYDIITGNNSANADALTLKANNRIYTSRGIQTLAGFNFNTGSLRHKVELGFRYHEDEMDRFQWEDGYAMDNGVMKLTQAGAPGTESNRIESAAAAAAYVQYRLSYGSLTLTPGLRHENIRHTRLDYGRQDPQRAGTNLVERNNHVSVFMPGLGLDYKVSEAMRLFGGIHKGFAPPGTTEGAQAEESINYEAGVKYNKGALAGQVVGFYNDYSNLLGADLAAGGGGGTTDMFNGGAAVTRGIEASTTYDVLAQRDTRFSLPITVAYTYTLATFSTSFNSTFDAWLDVESGDELPYLPQHQLAVLASLEHDRFSISLSSKYMSAMRTVAGQGEAPANSRIDGFFVLDASAHYALNKRLQLFGAVTNVSDAVYAVADRPAGLRPGMPRAFMAGLKLRF